MLVSKFGSAKLRQTIGLSIATLINGSGKYSIDNIMYKG
jgi:hypothetical protein